MHNYFYSLFLIIVRINSEDKKLKYTFICNNYILYTKVYFLIISYIYTIFALEKNVAILILDEEV